MIRYRLKKDLNKGSKFMFVPMGTETIATKYGYVLETANGGSYYFTEDQLDKDEEYFELIKEEPKEVFTWDDKLVFEWAEYLEEVLKIGTSTSQIPAILFMWKERHKSKTPPVQSKPDTSKERILVNATSCGDSGKEIFVFTSQKYNLNKLTEIKQAIEDTLNGIPTPSFINYSLDHKFTQQDLDKAREQTWEAASK